MVRFALVADSQGWALKEDIVQRAASKSARISSAATTRSGSKARSLAPKVHVVSWLKRAMTAFVYLHPDMGRRCENTTESITGFRKGTAIPISASAHARIRQLIGLASNLKMSVQERSAIGFTRRT